MRGVFVSTLAVLLAPCGCALVSGLSDVRVCDTCADAAPAPADAALADAPPDGCACGASPAGWTPVGVTVAPTDACPSGATQKDWLTATYPASPCPCACSVALQPSCTTGNVTRFHGTSCISSAAAVPASPGCNGASLSLSTYEKATGPAPSGGSCGPPSTALAGAYTKSPVRTCVASCSALCGTKLRACVQHDGAATCPAGFPTAISAGADVTSASCACGACTLAPSCLNATLRFYGDAMCASEVFAVAADGACHSTLGSSSYPISATAFEATASAGCTATPGTPSATYSGAVTICCK